MCASLIIINEANNYSFFAKWGILLLLYDMDSLIIVIIIIIIMQGL